MEKLRSLEIYTQTHLFAFIRAKRSVYSKFKPIETQRSDQIGNANEWNIRCSYMLTAKRKSNLLTEQRLHEWGQNISIRQLQVCDPHGICYTRHTCSCPHHASINLEQYVCHMHTNILVSSRWINQSTSKPLSPTKCYSNIFFRILHPFGQHSFSPHHHLHLSIALRAVDCNLSFITRVWVVSCECHDLAVGTISWWCVWVIPPHMFHKGKTKMQRRPC